MRDERLSALATSQGGVVLRHQALDNLRESPVE